MPKQEPLSGIIGFFDILGYQSFLVNNEPESAAYQVLDAVTRIGKVIPKYIRNQFAGTQKYPEVLKSIRWLVFSDTILVTSVAPKEEDPFKASIRWVVFLLTCATLQRHMFEFGLPLRGAISTGKFMIKGNCFAGRPIVEAYRLTQDIDLAATILFPNTYKELIQVGEKSKTPKLFRVFIDRNVAEYSVPLKTKGNTLSYTLDFFAYDSPTGQKLKEDMVQMVFETFWKHKKDISSDAVTKARNTEQYLRFLKFKHPKSFSVK